MLSGPQVAEENARRFTAWVASGRAAVLPLLRANERKVALALTFAGLAHPSESQHR